MLSFILVVLSAPFDLYLKLLLKIVDTTFGICPKVTYRNAMSTLKITYPSEKDHDQEIEIVNLSADEFSVGDASDGLCLSPDLRILLPAEGNRIFEVDSGIVELNHGEGMIVSGYSRVRLIANPEQQNDDDASLPLLAIGALINGVSRLKDILKVPSILDIDTAQTISTLFTSLVNLERSTDQERDNRHITKHLIAGQIVDALLLMSDKLSRAKEEGVEESPPLERLKKYLFANLDRKVTTSDMASHIGMSRQHFCQWVKPLLGKPPALYLRELRMERSLDRLLNSDDSIESIAEKIGYADRYHFGKEFKKHFGASPARLRKQQARQSATYVSKVNGLLKLGKSAQALRLCEEGLGLQGLPTTESNQLKLLRGTCYKLMDQNSKAMEAWNQLEGTPLAVEAGMHRCQLALEGDHIDSAVSELQHLWKIDELDKSELIQAWIRQTTILRYQKRRHALQKYLDFRKDYFVDDITSVHAALYALRDIGNNLEIPIHCPTDKRACILALRRSALYDRLIEEYGDEMDDGMLVRIYTDLGDFERVLSLPAAGPQNCAKALADMGRPADAISAFPDHCSSALLALGKYDELLERFTDINDDTIHALIALGRLDELYDRVLKGSFYYQLAQCYIDPESLLEENFPETFGHFPVVQYLTVIKRLTEERMDGAVSLLNQMDSVKSPSLWPWYQQIGVFALVPVLKALVLKEKDELHEELTVICQDFRYFNRQTTYYDSAYLNGDIDADTYQSQPFKFKLYDRWTFVRAIAHDLGGRHDKACDAYRELVDKTVIWGLDNLVRHRFSEWRLKELG